MSRTRFPKLLPLVSTLALILPLVLALAAPVSAATVTVCPAGPPTCDYATITAAVAGETYPVIINVYPGTYNESVDLYKLAGGDITLRTVNTAGTPTPGTATVNGGGSSAFDTSSVHAGNLTIDGFVVVSDNDDGIYVQVNSDVVIRDVIANGTGDDGIHVNFASGNVTVEDCTANDNDQDGFALHGIDGKLTLTRCTANDNGADGIYVHDIPGDLLISNCTAIGNGHDGFDPGDVEGDVTITACVVRLTVEQEGVELDELGDADLILVNGNIICENNDGLYSDETTGAEGNWWGCTTGPNTVGCDTVIGSGPVDYTPWIDTITASAPASAVAGEPTVVTFQFSNPAQTVFLGEGPGDLHGDPTFVVTTDNGTVTDPGFINAPNGVLEVTLVPQTEGTATVTVVGPCGPDEQIVLGVQAAAADFVPEPGTLMLLGSGLAGLAGYAGLRMRRK